MTGLGKTAGCGNWWQTPGRRVRRGRKGRHGSQAEGAARSKRHTGPLGGCERLEGRQMLTVSLLQGIAPQSLPATSSAASEVSLSGRFALADVVGTVVKVDANARQGAGRFFVELFDTAAAAPVRATPTTAANFLAYVDDGSFDGSIVHRSVPQFVIQGGGFRAPTAAAGQPGGNPTAIPTKGTIADEVGNPNQRGTIAMAKVSAGNGSTTPNSATSQWFVNVQDNDRLDTEFTAFGRVLGNGMTVVDTLAAVPRYDGSNYFGNAALTELPLWEVPGDGVIRPGNFVTITDMGRASADELLSFAATAANPGLLNVQLVGNRLVMTRAGAAAGTTTVTVRATAAFDSTDFVEHSFVVTVPEALPEVIEAVGAIGLTYDAAGRMFANGSMLTLGGNPIDYNAMNTLGWRAVAVEAVGGVNTLVWRHASGNLHFWRFSNAWAQLSSDGWQSPGSSEFYASETTFGIDFNSDSTIGVPLTVLETTGSVTLAHDPAGRLHANGTMLTLGGNPVDYNAMNAAGWRAVAAEAVGGTNTLVWRHASGNLHFWRFSDSWAQQGGDGWHAPGSSEFNTAEVTLNMDFNDDGVIGAALTTLESVGAVRLAHDTAGSLFADSTRITLSGGPVDYRAYDALGWKAVAAERIGGVNTLVWRHASGNLHFWRFSDSWAQEGGDGWQSPGSTEFNATEVALTMDFNDDGVIGAALTPIESVGGVTLAYDRAGRLFAGSTMITLGGNAIDFNAMNAAGWRAVAAEAVEGVNSLVWRHASGNLHFWRFSTSWAQQSSDGWQAPGSGAFYASERAFGTDFNNDSVIGPLTVIENVGAVRLGYDDAGHLFANATKVSLGGNPVDFLAMNAAGWRAVAADAIDGVNTLVWRHASGNLHFWRLSGSWAQQSSDGWQAPRSSEYQATEVALGMDLNGNGSIGN